MTIDILSDHVYMEYLFAKIHMNTDKLKKKMAVLVIGPQSTTLHLAFCLISPKLVTASPHTVHFNLPSAGPYRAIQGLLLPVYKVILSSYALGTK